MPGKAPLPFTLRLYRALMGMAAPLASPLLNWRLKRGKEDAQRMGERRGIPSLPRPPGPLIWVHAASVGEFVSVLSLLERIRSRDISVLLTSGTVTAARIAAQRLPDGALHQFVPLDVPHFVETFFDHWRPNLALIAESEFWPNLITEGRRRGIPFVLVNGRLSDRSYGRWRLARGTAKALLSHIDLCLAQESSIAERFEQLGAKQVVTTGNLKFDTPPPPAEPAQLSALERSMRNRPIVLAASTHPARRRSSSMHICAFVGSCRACLRSSHRGIPSGARKSSISPSRWAPCRSCVRADTCRIAARKSMSRTQSASWGCSIVSPLSFSWADRSSDMGVRTRSNPRSSIAQSCTGRMSETFRRSTLNSTAIAELRP
jgi:hypothetical protein